MPAGIIIYNAGGTVQIDDTYRNLAVSESGTQAASPTVPGSGVLAYQYAALTGGNYKWWRFDVPTPTSATYGFQVFDAAGNCTFDALQKYARVVDSFAGPATATTITKTYTAGRQYAVITTKRGAKVEQEVRAATGMPSGWYEYRRRIIGARAYVSGVQVIAGWSNPTWPETWNGPIQVVPTPAMDDTASQYLVLDVTGY